MDAPIQRYTRSFYAAHREITRRAAKEIVPLIMNLVQPRSVIDVGCGIGTWLSVFKECGVEDVWGIDGDYVDRRMLEIPEPNFIPFDLRRPFRIDREYDLAVSLEVGEHLPEQSAKQFVDSLARLAPVILFSSAIPFQGGTHHVNEQWPDYWVGLFREKGFVSLDCLRRRIWHNKDVAWYLAQNSFLVVRAEHLEKYPLLEKEFHNSPWEPLAMVHPLHYLDLVAAVHPRNLSLRKVMAALPFLAKNAMLRRLKRVYLRVRGS